MTPIDCVVARSDLERCKLIDTPPSGCGRTDRFAFSANNVTCAAMGDELKSWQILPASQGVRQHSCVGLWRGDRLGASQRAALPIAAFLRVSPPRRRIACA
ncbi:MULTISPECIES: hypothetical protein [unclassified Bradyrhizobium]